MQNTNKQHYKLFKSGKHWVTMTIASTAVVLSTAGATLNPSINAFAASDNKVEKVTVDKDKQGAKVDFADGQTMKLNTEKVGDKVVSATDDNGKKLSDEQIEKLIDLVLDNGGKILKTVLHTAVQSIDLGTGGDTKVKTDTDADKATLKDVLKDASDSTSFSGNVKVTFKNNDTVAHKAFGQDIQPGESKDIDVPVEKMNNDEASLRKILDGKETEADWKNESFEPGVDPVPGQDNDLNVTLKMSDHHTSWHNPKGDLKIHYDKHTPGWNYIHSVIDQGSKGVQLTQDTLTWIHDNDKDGWTQVMDWVNNIVDDSGKKVYNGDGSANDVIGKIFAPADWKPGTVTPGTPGKDGLATYIFPKKDDPTPDPDPTPSEPGKIDIDKHIVMDGNEETSADLDEKDDTYSYTSKITLATDTDAKEIKITEQFENVQSYNKDQPFKVLDEDGKDVTDQGKFEVKKSADGYQDIITWTSTHEFANKYDNLKESKDLTVNMDGVSLKDAEGKKLVHYLKDGGIQIPNQIGVTETDESGKVIEGTDNSSAKIPDGWSDISEPTELEFSEDPEVDKKAVQEDNIDSTSDADSSSNDPTDSSSSNSTSSKNSDSVKSNKDEDGSESSSNASSTSSK